MLRAAAVASVRKVLPVGGVSAADMHTRDR